MKKTTRTDWRVVVAATLAAAVLTFAWTSATAQDPPKGAPKDDGKGGKTDPSKGQSKEQQKAAEKALGELRSKGDSTKNKPAVEADPLELELQAFKKLQFENYRNDQRVPVSALTGPENQAFNNGEADERIVKKKARFEIARFTDSSEDSRQSEIHLGVIRFLQARGGASDDYKVDYKRHLLQECADFLIDKDGKYNISTYAKINLLTLIDELHEFKDLAAERTGVATLIKVLTDYKRHADGVLFVAMDVLSRAKAREQTTVDEEGRAVAALLGVAKRGHYHELFLEKLCRTFGELKRAYLPAGVPERVEVATFLGGVVMNDNSADLTRIAAATAVGNLDVQGVVNWDFGTQAAVLGRGWKVYMELAKANILADSPKVSKQRLSYMGARLHEATQRAAKTAEALGTAPGVVGKLSSLADAAMPGLNDVLEGKEPELDAIATWTDSNKPAKLQFSPRAEPILIENKRTTVAGPASPPK